ncbi:MULTISPECIES: hypothetical protein [unclassified Rhizobium]|uniref:hypothetical protein n=1 Tax=unclassified Rhizobium TaxID=2613769 RepID=UPI0016005070|nr:MULTISPECIES: hypothetical protein [unclassified Rhizobium]MBB1248044.1 hypothetical protein [Rhizobium sp. G21]MCV3765345.1 hypothetical protein [Rhizobium sp. TRM95796]
MQLSASIRSPLRERDSWPSTGPVYALPQATARRAGDRTLWLRFLDRLSAPEKDDETPVSPIYY